jgi:two-component system chemotaxis response regulator CheY
MKILVVDDAKAMRYVLIKALNELGQSDIVEAEDVESAKAALMKQKPDLIFSDWNMPDGSGLDLLKSVRAHPVTKELPFIMVTTEHDRKKIMEATRAGLQSYLLKPIDKKLLKLKLQELSKIYNWGILPAAAEPSSTNSSDAFQSQHPLRGVITEHHIAAINQILEGVLDEKLAATICKEVFTEQDSKEQDYDKLLLALINETVLASVETRLRALC